MKKTNGLFWLFLLTTLILKGQTSLKADAGKDSTYCFNSNVFGNVILGATPTASGGLSPYTYNWIIYSKRTGKNLSILSDNNINHNSNPSFTYLSSDVLVCKIIVTDANNDVATDSSIIGISYLYSLLCCGSINGIGLDSVELNPQIDGGVKPLVYNWTPEVELSNPYIRNPKAKTVYPNITYFVEVSDSLGCKVKDNWGLKVTDIKNGDLKTGFISYKNPVSNSGSMDFTSELLGSKLQIVSASGIIQYQTKVENESIPLGSLISTTGIYYYTLTTPIGTILSGSFIRE